MKKAIQKQIQAYKRLRSFISQSKTTKTQEKAKKVTTTISMEMNS